MNRTGTSAVALEDFIQAVQSQLDTAQARMTLRAQNDRLPLTFAIRDISMDLKAHVEVQSGQIRIRPAGPTDTDASVIHVVFAAITKPMIDENAAQLALDSEDEGSLDDLGDTLDEDERRRLEGIGVRTVAKLNELTRKGLGRSVGRITNLPAGKLESVLAHAAKPMVNSVESETVTDTTDSLRQKLRLRGRNFLKDGVPPKVLIAGRPVNIVRATDGEMLLEPDSDQLAGQMSLSHDARTPTEFWFDETRAQSGKAYNGATP